MLMAAFIFGRRRLMLRSLFWSAAPQADVDGCLEMRTPQADVERSLLVCDAAAQADVDGCLDLRTPYRDAGTCFVWRVVRHPGMTAADVWSDTRGMVQSVVCCRGGVLIQLPC